MAGTHHGSDATASSAGQTSLAFLPPGTVWAAYDAAMDDARRTWFQQNLLTERARLVVWIEDARPEAPGQMTYGSQAAMASEVFAQQRDIALRERASRQLEAVDAALARLDAGTFGVCRNCGRPIPEERLEARPWAPLCIDCQRLEDR